MFAKCLETCQFPINKVGSYKIANPNCYGVLAQNNPVFLSVEIGEETPKTSCFKCNLPIKP